MPSESQFIATLPNRAVFAIGSLLRLYLAVVNSEANDDHLAVIRIIADEHRLPRLLDAWEGFQPKLYHVTAAILWNLSPWQSSGVRVRIAQLVSCAAGIATLFIVHRALGQRSMSPSVRLLAFALVALNPTLIGLNAQATNDSFVILFVTLALYEGSQFFRTGATQSFVGMTAAAVLATLSKGNGLVIFVAVVLTLVHAVIRAETVAGLSRRKLARFSAAFVAVFLTAVTAFGSYRPNWEDTGDPFETNVPPAPLPDLFKRSYVARPGTISIADTYFTFRFVDLLEHPVITSDAFVYPLHRTSLWSQVYGRAHDAHFAQYPPSWANTTPLALTIVRLILVFAIVPTVLLLVGMIRAVVALLRNIRPRRDNFDCELRTLAAVGFVAFVVVYSLIYRDFSTMKAEFLFPALLAYVFFIADETERVARSMRNGWARKGLACAFVALLALYVGDVLVLAVQLT